MMTWNSQLNLSAVAAVKKHVPLYELSTSTPLHKGGAGLIVSVAPGLSVRETAVLPFSYLTGCYDNQVRMWSSSGDLLQSVDGHSGPVKAVKWVGGGERRFLSASQDQYIHVWKVGWVVVRGMGSSGRGQVVVRGTGQ